MARSQAQLHNILDNIEGVTDAWFQKPLNTTLVPPYIVYELDNEEVKRADNKVYVDWDAYTVTLVAREPDSPIRNVIKNLDHARFDRKFIAAGLYHFVYKLYF